MLNLVLPFQRPCCATIGASFNMRYMNLIFNLLNIESFLHWDGCWNLMFLLLYILDISSIRILCMIKFHSCQHIQNPIYSDLTVRVGFFKLYLTWLTTCPIWIRFLVSECRFFRSIFGYFMAFLLLTCIKLTPRKLYFFKWSCIWPLKSDIVK
jgi:hypothetical protein